MDIIGIRNSNPNKIVAKDSDGNVLTNGEITALADRINLKFPGRSLFFIFTENNVGGIAWVISTILSGNVPLILNAHIDPALRDNLLKTYQPDYIVCPSSQEGKETWSHEDTKTWRRNDFTFSGYTLLSHKYIETYRHIDHQLNPLLSHLLPTSGSTGSPKLVRHKYENIEASAINISTFFNLSPSDRPLLVLPLYYTMGLSIVFSHFLMGATILITDRSMTDPVFWKFMKEEKATSFTGVPFSYEILDKMRFYRMNLPDLKLLTQGGGKMPEELNRKFVDYCLATGKEWIATYGQSEGTARMAWLPPQYALSKMGSIGIAVPNGRLWLRNEEGEEISTSPATGEMCYEGKNVTMGYALCREDLAKGDERNGFLPTGDIAYRDAEGFYYIKGRMGRFLKLFGNRIGLDECEHILKSKISCDCACTGTDEKMIVYLTDPNQKEIAISTIVETLHLPANVIEIRVISSLPKNEAGKTLYSKL